MRATLGNISGGLMVSTGLFAIVNRYKTDQRRAMEAQGEIVPKSGMKDRRVEAAAPKVSNVGLADFPQTEGRSA